MSVGKPVLVEAKDWNAIIARLEILEALTYLGLSDDDPIKGNLTAYEGVGTDASRDDHVHPDLTRDPDYDTDYYSYSLNQTRQFTHGLGSADLYVQIIGYDSSGTGKYHNKNVGGRTIGGATEYHYGGQWKELDSTYVSVIRMVDDEHWDQIRLVAWKMILA